MTDQEMSEQRATQQKMIDPFGRSVDYLRVSVTDRCDFRCAYCMSEDMTFLPKSEVLSLEELERLCRTFIKLGVRKLRLTGGEPLVRRNVMWLFQEFIQRIAHASHHARGENGNDDRPG